MIDTSNSSALCLRSATPSHRFPFFPASRAPRFSCGSFTFTNVPEKKNWPPTTQRHHLRLPATPVKIFRCTTSRSVPVVTCKASKSQKCGSAVPRSSRPQARPSSFQVPESTAMSAANIPNCTRTGPQSSNIINRTDFCCAHLILRLDHQPCRVQSQKVNIRVTQSDSLDDGDTTNYTRRL